MDPNPQTSPILSYVMSKLPTVGPGRSTHEPEFDIEQPPHPPPTSKEPYFELTERMPQLTDPKVVAEMREAVKEVAETRSVLKNIGERPDHESVDIAKAKLLEIDGNPALDDAAKGIEKQAYKAVISLDEMHQAYAKMLDEAEERVKKIYEKAVEGADCSPDDADPTVQVGEEVNEEVVGILWEASGRQVERIDLSGRQLPFLPEAFGQLRTLRALDLSDNQLKLVPDSIGHLENLEELNLSSNLLEALPDSIGLLLNLRILNASTNKLIALPDSICHFGSLVELDVSFNKLTYLPTYIGYELVNLRTLSIPLNKIRSLPTSIGEMKSLHLLDAHFNELHGLPRSIGRLAYLEILNLSSNFSDLSELPDTIGDLINLKELDLSNNQIHTLPDTFGQLQNLIKLSLEENPLVIPPKEVVNEGVEAIKAFMAKRWNDILEAEVQKSMTEGKEETEASLLTLSTSWLSNMVSTVSESLSEYLGTQRKSDMDSYLNQQL